MQISLTADHIWIADKPVDFRKAINGLCVIAESELKEQPTSGIFIFYNKNRNRLKILGWHGNGFILLYKRLEKKKFFIEAKGSDKIEINNKQLNWLLAGFDWQMLSNWNNPQYDSFC